MLMRFGEKTLLMGILNVTPDSFSDGGKFTRLESALLRAEELVEEGADLIDIGGESTRPSAQSVSLEEELNRVIPIVRRLALSSPVPISVDTYKAEVARQALEAGAHMINDVWGLKADPKMAETIASYHCPVVIMHNRHDLNYNNLVHDIRSDLQESIRIAQRAGIKEEQIIIDPGIGFAKTYDHNLMVMNQLEKIVDLGYPVLLGTSRKSMIGLTLDLPVEERIEGTAATVALGISKGCKIIRVHDVKYMSRVAKMTDAIVRKGKNG
jgi:dihydropteroate synthase